MTSLEILCNHKNDMEINKMDLSDILCFDVETTGLDTEEDEILQLSIIDGNKHVLFNEYIQPKHHNEWNGAQNIHGISPDDVKDKPTIDDYRNQIQGFFSKAKVIVGYNHLQFDNRLIEQAGINIPTDALQFDVMLEFAPIFGEWNEKYNDWKWQKLYVCANYYGYEKSGNFHDSLEDAKATLYCFYSMLTFEELKNELGIENYVIEEMTAQELSTLYKASDKFEQFYIDRLIREIVNRAGLVLMRNKIEPKYIWNFADEYNAVFLFDLWRNLDHYNYNQSHFIQDCLNLIKDHELS